MDFDLLIAVVSGLVATLVMSGLMMAAPMFGLSGIDMPGLLGTTFDSRPHPAMGLLIHLVVGVVFALGYALIFSGVTGVNIILLAVMIAVAHWFITGAFTGFLPLVHTGIRTGTTKAPGAFMVRGGMRGFVGGLVSHLVYGLVLALSYGLLIGSFIA